MSSTKIEILSNNKALNIWLRNAFRDFPKIEVVTAGSDFKLYVEKIDFLYKDGLQEFLELAIVGGGLLGRIDSVDRAGQINQIRLPKPQPNFYSNRVPESYIALVDSQLKISSTNFYRSVNFKFSNLSVGCVRDFRWENSPAQECAEEKVLDKLDIVIPTGMKKLKNSYLINDLLSSLSMSSSNYVSKVHVVVDDLEKNYRHLQSKPGVEFLDYKERFNFSKKVNIGARNSESEIILFLNDDTLPISTGWEGELLKTFGDNSVGVVGSLLLFPNGRIQHAGVATNGTDVHHFFRHAKTMASEFVDLPNKYEVLAVTGAFLAVRKSVFDKIGGMDESFPVNFGDIDFCLRVREQGFRCIQNNSIVFQHLESASRIELVDSFEVKQLSTLLKNHNLSEEMYLPNQPRFSSVYDLASFYGHLKRFGFFRTILQGVSVSYKRYVRSQRD